MIPGVSKIGRNSKRSKPNGAGGSRQALSAPSPPPPAGGVAGDSGYALKHVLIGLKFVQTRSKKVTFISLRTSPKS